MAFIEIPVVKKKEDIVQIEMISIAQRLASVPTTYDLLKQAAHTYGNKTFIQFVPNPENMEVVEEYSFTKMFKLTTQFANFLVEKGVKRNNVITLLLPNSPLTLMALIAAETVAIANPISPALNVVETHHLLETTQSKLLITIFPLWEKLLEDDNAQQFDQVILLDNPQQVVSEKVTIVNIDQLTTKDKLCSTLPNAHDTCALFHTSGTTGLPKLIKMTHAAKIYGAWSALVMCGYNENDVIFAALPYFHVGAPVLAGTAALLAGSKVMIMSPFGWMDPKCVKHFWSLVEKFKISSVTALPFTFRQLLRAYRPNKNCSSLRHVLSGNALLENDYKKFKEFTGVKIQELYGATESGFVITSTLLEDDTHQGTLGIPYPYNRVRSVILNNNGDYLRDCDAGEIGVLLINGPGVTAGYLPALLDVDSFPLPSWLKTGDLGYIDNEGYLHFVERVSHTIKNGEQPHGIFPMQFENLLLEHPDIAYAAIVGQPNRQGLETPLVYISIHPDSRVEPAELTKQLASMLLERGLEVSKCLIWDTLPTNGMGKIVKLILKLDAIKNAYLEALQEIKSDEDEINVEVSMCPIKEVPVVQIQISADLERLEEFRSQVGTSLKNYKYSYQLSETVLVPQNRPMFTP